MQPLNVCLLNGVPIFEQLALEEALLRTQHENVCLYNSGASPAVVLGISSKVSDHIDTSAALSFPVIRRFSGGGSVLVDENTIFLSFLIREQHVTPDSLMQWVEAILKPVFAPHDFRALERDFVIGTKKIGGNAQYITKDAALQHMTFLWDFDPQKMAILKMPPKMPSYRAGREHEEFCGRLKNFFPSRDAFRARLLASLQERFALTEKSPEALMPVVPPHRRATSFVDVARIA